MLVFLRFPTSAPEIALPPPAERLRLCRAPTWCSWPGPPGVQPPRDPRVCAQVEAEQHQAQEEGGDERTEATGSHGAAPGGVRVRAAAVGMGGFNCARALGPWGRGGAEPARVECTAGGRPPPAVSQSPGIRCHSWPGGNQEPNQLLGWHSRTLVHFPFPLLPPGA